MTGEGGTSPRATVVDQCNDATGQGVIWTLEPSSQLNASLVRLDAGGEIGEHVNDEVDVVVVVVEGTGELSVDDDAWRLGPATLAPSPAGTRRRIRAGPQPLPT
ncbi:MAG: hypothetical protein ACR2MN_00180 [Acidimicrobiales bacterium]